jgi:hypothetical protein
MPMTLDWESLYGESPGHCVSYIQEVLSVEGTERQVHFLGTVSL